MQHFKSQFLQTLANRGFVNQITHEQELDELMSVKKIAAYIGFDCTAKSLHIGSLIQIMVLQILQQCGHQPIILLGGATTKIGDPSGKDEARKVLDDNLITQNLAGIEKTLKKFDLSKKDSSLPAFKFVNNDDWLKDLKYLDFLRNVGKHFSVNKMLTFESVKLRLDRHQPLSFLEFNYMILQSYDFVELNKKYGCALQIGGSDQWGNIVGGVDLARRIAAGSHNSKLGSIAPTLDLCKSETINKHKVGVANPELIEGDELHSENHKMQQCSDVFGLTTPLLTTCDGKKMGKTADGAVWLDEEMLSPFDYFQYFRNTQDEDVSRFLRLFTNFSLDEICAIEKKDINEQKEILAQKVTEICHGRSSANESLSRAKNMFSSNADANLLPQKTVNFSEENKNGKKLIEILRETNLVESGGEAKRLIKGGGVKIDGKKIDDENHIIKFDEKNPFFKVALGKKKIFRVNINLS